MNKFYVALLCTFMADALCAQSPGGIGAANVSLWLKPDGLATGTLSTWTYANNANSFTAGPVAPTVVANSFNFWPAVNFSGNGQSYMTGPSGASAPLAANQLAYSIFAVWSSSVAVGGSNMRVWAQRESGGGAAFDGASLFVYPAGATASAHYQVSAATYGDEPEVDPFVTGVAFPTNTSPPFVWTPNTPPPVAQSILTYAPNTTYISSLNLLNANTNDLELMDQTNYGATPSVTSTDPAGSATTNRLLSTQANLLGARTNNAAGDENFNGNLAELIVTNTSVTAQQRQQIFSYLAMKYGIPLAGDYFSSAGTTLWASGPNSNWGASGFTFNYNHSVFGLAKDVASGLSITQSNSLSTGSGSGAGQSGAGNIVLANPSVFSDQSFMLIGSNNQGFAQVTTNLPSTSPVGAERLATQWLVENSGNVGNVDLSFDFTGIATDGTKGVVGATSTIQLVVDNDGDGDFSTGTQSVYAPTSWNAGNTIATWSGLQLNGATRVVMGVLTGTAITPLPVNWVSFTAKANGPDVDLNWTVSANQNAKVYDVERSSDGASFTSIGQVSNQSEVQSYGYVDANAGPGTHYYRVLETDLDGKSIYSKIVSVNMSGSDFGVRLLNNPVVNGMDAELEITAANSGNASMEIWALGGTRVATLMQGIPNGTTRIRIPTANLAPGTYAVKIRVNDVTQTVQIVKL